MKVVQSVAVTLCLSRGEFALCGCVGPLGWVEQTRGADGGVWRLGVSRPGSSLVEEASSMRRVRHHHQLFDYFEFENYISRQNFYCVSL